METDKRPLYLKLMVLIINIIPIIIILYGLIGFRFNPLMFIQLGVTLFISVLPVLISKSNSKLKDTFGYGIPLLMLLAIAYSIWHYFTCTGKWCNMGDTFLIMILTPSLIIFTFFYIIGNNINKWTEKTYRNLLILETIVLLSLYLLPLYLSIYKNSLRTR